jgi:putrescine transport system ATP-binding protein
MDASQSGRVTAPLVRFVGVTKRFGDVVAVDDVSLDIAEGECFALLGGSGSGKTTLLRLLAGFERPTSGRVFLGDEDITDVPPHRRPINMMFQSYALFPHMNVERNVGFGLRQEGLPKDEIRDRVAAALKLVEMETLIKRRPDQLSGGQRQRVALARALVKRPKVLLLDEPLAALDKRLREQTQFELMRIQDEVGITFIVVTHDQEEAMTLGDRIVVMRDGRVEQAGPPTLVYSEPATTFVARFVGSPPMNLFEGPVPAIGAGQGVIVGIRPHDVEVLAAGAADRDASALVELVEPLGSECRVHLTLDGRRAIAIVPPDRPLSAGDRAGLRFRRDRLHWFEKTTGRRVMLNA